MRPDDPRFRVALALGGNLGDPEKAFHTALEGLRPHLDILSIASIFRTSPVSSIPQPSYLNTALTAETRLDPWQLLGLAKALELGAGRARGARFGPRPLDVDLLLFGGIQVNGPALQIPHPRLRQRKFFLAPLAEIAPELKVPPGGEAVAELLADLGDEQQLEDVGWKHRPHL